MLMITRRAGERIRLGDDTIVEVIEIAGNSVRIGISAPRSIPVYREEIWVAVQEENRAAATAETHTMPKRTKTNPNAEGG